MSVKELFENHAHEEIEVLFDAWAERDFVDIPTDVFFATLEEIGARRQRLHIEMNSEIVGDRLVLIPPKDIPLPFTVYDNEIILDDYTIRMHLKGACA